MSLTMRLQSVAICLAAGLVMLAPAWGQRVTPYGPVPERDLVTLTPEMPFNRALEIIQTVGNRVIVDPMHRETPIGVSVDRESWRHALEMLARAHGLQVITRERYLELRPRRDEDLPSDYVDPAAATLDSREVDITAIFFEANQQALQEFGIDWSTLSGGRVDVSAGHGGAGRVSQDGLNLGIGGNINRSIRVDALLNTFESRRTGEVLARPQIKVRSGKQGQIQVGTDFRVTTVDYAGNTVVQFFSTGTILNVQPVIITEDDTDFVDLIVNAERSSLLDPDLQLVNRTNARTTTLLMDGEQTALGGLYGREINSIRSGIPVLKDLPWWALGLRYLSGYTRNEVTKTELIVLLEVNIVPSVRQRAQQRLQEQQRLPQQRRPQEQQPPPQPPQEEQPQEEPESER